MYGDERFIAMCQQRGLPVTVERIKWYTDNGVALWELAKHGLGLCVMAEFIGECTAQMERVLPEIRPFEYPVWLVAHRELQNSRRMRLVFDLLADALSKHF